MLPELDDAAVSDIAPVDDVNADVRASIAQLSKEPVETAAAPAADAHVQERQRNERGQFIKADGSVDADQSPTVPDADPAPVTPVQPSTAVEAPKSWSADAKADFGKLPPAVQAAVLKRESEIDNGGQRWSEEKRRYEEAFAPVREASTRHRVEPAEVIKRLSAANDFLERDPGNAIRWLADAYKVDLSKLSTEPQSPRPQADPLVAQLSDRFSSVEAYIESQQQGGINSQLEAFKSAPGHEHFETVKVAMGKLMLAGLATDMQSAYDQAVWALPDTRASMLTAQTAGNDAARKAREQEAAAKARRGAISAFGSPNGGAGPPIIRSDPNATAVDDARAAYHQLRGH